MKISNLWDICLQFEYDKDELLEGLDNFLRKYKNKRILDCACGTGFLTLDLIKRGYEITCSDRSKEMLEEFVKNAKKKQIPIKPRQLMWSDLSKKFKNQFDLVMCRGSSLVYASSWDNSTKNNQRIIKNSLKNFFECLKPNGILYVDTTSEKNIERGLQIINYPAKEINGYKVKFIDNVSVYREKKIRIWEPAMIINGKKHTLKRYSYYLPQEELVKIMLECGFESVKKQKINGEHYDVFIGSKVKTWKG